MPLTTAVMPGLVMIQKYDYGHYIEVKLAIADLGVGIRGSLIAAHSDLQDTCSGYIQRALAGLSSRTGPRGGHGLGAISRIATTSGGSLHIRSETGLVASRRPRRRYWPRTILRTSLEPRWASPSAVAHSRICTLSRKSATILMVSIDLVERLIMRSYQMTALFGYLEVPGPDLLLRDFGRRAFPVLEQQSDGDREG